jgi:glycosyltransferase involved in cell wall biosynthesis
MGRAPAWKYEKPKVLINGPLPPPLGGMATYCQDYLRTSLISAFDITFCRSNVIKGVFSARGLFRFALRILNSITIIMVWVVTLLSKRPDIVHVHTNSYTGFYVKSLLTLLARIVGAKTILHVHGAEFREFYVNSPRILRWLIRRQLKSNSSLVALSREWRRFFESIGIPGDKVVVMTNSVLMPEVAKDKNAVDKPTVLFMSVFEKRKGVYELVGALEDRPALLDRFYFVLAGPKSRDWALVAERISGLELPHAVEMPGPVIGESKDRLYRSADIYVLQSYAEGMPIGLLEAMSYGLACVTTPVGGIPDVIQDGQNGMLVPPGDVDALVEALEMLILEPDLRLRLGHEARATVERRYNWVDRASQIKELYSNLLGIQQNKASSSEEDA